MSQLSVYDVPSAAWHNLHTLTVSDAGTFFPVKRAWVAETFIDPTTFALTTNWHLVGNFTVPGSVPITSFTATSSFLGGPYVTVQWTVQTDPAQPSYDYTVEVDFYVDTGGGFNLTDSFTVPQSTGIKQSPNYAAGNHVFARLTYHTADNVGPNTDTATLTLT